MESFELVIPKTLYTNTVLMRSAYRYLDRAYFHFSDEDVNWVIKISKKDPDCNVEVIAKEFENTLISQTLREIISKKTKTLREIILARSLTSTYVDEEDPVLKIKAEQEDISEDELGRILKNWFEVYGN